MDADFPKLQWDKKYLENFEDKIIDNNVLTSFFFDPDITALIDWAKKKSMTIKDLETDYLSPAYEISMANKTIAHAGLSVDEDCIIFRISEDDVASTGYNMIKNYFEERLIFPAEVNHGKEEFSIHDTKIIAKSWTWDDTPITYQPTAFFKFYLDKKLIAKMYMLYRDFEMAETCPTISKFEVAVGMKGKGYGKKIIHAIEERLIDQGFNKLWLEQTESMGFWRKMGYEIDIDEGWKYLYAEDEI
jgi:GNAT superfamily N-acetyltransferase